MKSKDKAEKDQFIVGKRAVLEALRVQYPVKVLVVERSKAENRDEIMRNIYRLAKRQDIKILERDESWFRRRFHVLNPQGVVGVGEPYKFAEIEDIKIYKNSIILLLDRIQDPQNFGAIIRTAECVGISSIIIPEYEAADITDTVISVSSGAIFHVKIAKVANLVRAIDYLKKYNVWIVGADPSAKTIYYEMDYKNVPFAIIMGNEGEGIREGIRKKCDYLVSIPMRGKVSSLNVSVATGIVLFRLMEEKAKNSEYK